MKKTYINKAEDVNRKLILRPIIKIDACEPLVFLHLYYTNTWYTLWAVEYIIQDNTIIIEKCIGGAFILTDRENNYPKIPNEIILDLVTKFKPHGENSYTGTFDIVHYFNLYNFSLDIL